VQRVAANADRERGETSFVNERTVEQVRSQDVCLVHAKDSGFTRLTLVEDSSRDGSPLVPRSRANVSISLAAPRCGIPPRIVSEGKAAAGQLSLIRRPP